MKEAFDKIKKDVSSVVIYSPNHYNLFKMLYQQFKGETYNGDNLPVLNFKASGFDISVVDKELDNESFLINDDEDYDYWTGI